MVRPRQGILEEEGDRPAEGGVDSSRQLVPLGAVASCLPLTRLGTPGLLQARPDSCGRGRVPASSADPQSWPVTLR